MISDITSLVIALIFTTTAIVNRTRTRGYSRWWQVWPAMKRLLRRFTDSKQREVPVPEASASLVRTRSPSPEPRSHAIKNWLRYPDNRQFHTYLFSRFLHKFPFLVEIGYWVLIYWPYQFMRARTAVWISSSPERKEAIFDIATKNAVRILKAEAWLGIDIEQRLQSFILNQCQPWVMKALCSIYVAHITVGLAFLGYSYT